MRCGWIPLVLLTVATACHAPAPSPAVPSAPPIAIAATAPPATAPAVAAPAVAASGELVFRELLGASWLRFTWVLTRSESRVSLKGSCEDRRKNASRIARRPLRIDGTENDLSWGRPVAMEYEGKPSGDGLTYELARTSTSSHDACPHRNFARIRLVCRDGDIDALGAGARLLPATGRQTMATWQPVSRKHSPHALRCALTEYGNASASTEDLVTAPELVFSTPSVEWVEAGTKDAAYRFLHAPN